MMSESLTIRFFSLLALIWGGVLLYFYHSQRIFKYLAPDFHLFVLLGGLALFVLGVFCLISLPEKSGCCDDHDDCCDHHHHHEGHGPFTAFLVTLIPLSLSLAYTQDRLSLSSIDKRSADTANLVENMDASEMAFSREELEKAVDRTADGEFKITLMMAYYASGDESVRPVFDGLPVQIEGRVIPEKDNNEDGLRRRLYRLMITCCAADGQAVSVSLLFDEVNDDLPDDSWVTVTGVLRYELIDGLEHPVIQVKRMEATEEPYSEFILR